MDRQISISICVACGQSFEWFPGWYEARGLQIPPLKCPTCCDRALSKEACHVVKQRECLQEFPCCDVSQAVERMPFRVIEEQDGRRIKPYRRATVKGSRFGASWGGRIDVFDQRSDPTAPYARVRVMRTQHEAGAQMVGTQVEGAYPYYSKTAYRWEHSNEWGYVALDDPAPGDPTCRLIFAVAIQKWNRDDHITSEALWEKRASGSSRTGMHKGQAILAIVDEDHPIAISRVQDHGALNAGDRLALATASPSTAAYLLAQKGSKPVEITETIYDGEAK